MYLELIQKCVANLSLQRPPCYLKSSETLKLSVKACRDESVGKVPLLHRHEEQSLDPQHLTQKQGFSCTCYHSAIQAE